MDESAHSIALGAAIGIFIGYQPCMGLQMSIAVPIALMLRANIILAAALVWFTNPLTFIPLYYAAYLTGTWVYPVESLSLSEFSVLLHNFSWSVFVNLGEKTIIPLIIGCLILGLCAGLATYIIVRNLVNRIRKKDPAKQLENETN